MRSLSKTAMVLAGLVVLVGCSSTTAGGYVQQPGMHGQEMVWLSPEDGYPSDIKPWHRSGSAGRLAG